jgi:GntR family transcriptional regulator
MPSVRELSGQLAINPNTVQRAYRELEAEGYIYSIPGKGSFVAADKQVDQGRIDTLLKQLDEAVAELSYMGFSKDDLIRHILEGGKDA